MRKSGERDSSWAGSCAGEEEEEPVLLKKGAQEVNPSGQATVLGGLPKLCQWRERLEGPEVHLPTGSDSGSHDHPPGSNSVRTLGEGGHAGRHLFPPPNTM